MGVGPAGVVNRKIALLNGQPLQVHDDMLSFLVERGPIGLIGLIGLWVVIWRCAKPRGIARLMIVSLFVASLFRQTMHYRHMWLLLALALAYDNRRSDAEALDQVPVSAAPRVASWGLLGGRSHDS